MGLATREGRKRFVTVLTLAGIVIMAILQYFAVSRHQSLLEIPVLVSDIQSDMQTLRRNEKDFLTRKDLLYRQKFVDNYQLMQQKLQTLIYELQQAGIDNGMTKRLIEDLDLYRDKFIALVELQEKIGFNHELGLYGSLRDAIHQVEELLKLERQYQLSQEMLMLRRHEKDFMLRQDQSYIDKYDKDMALLRTDLSQAYLTPGVKSRIDSALAAYEQDFKALVAAMRQMGLNSDDGLQGEMRASIQQVEEMLLELRKQTMLLVDDAGSGTLMQIMGFALVLIVLVVVLIR